MFVLVQDSNETGALLLLSFFVILSGSEGSVREGDTIVAPPAHTVPSLTLRMR